MKHLILPDIKYEKDYILALEETENQTTDTCLARPTDNQSFTDFIEKLNSQAKGHNLPDGYLPATTYWLIDNDEFIGRVQIRHELNKQLINVGGHIGYYIRPSKRRMGYGKKILELGLKKAQELGIPNVLVTCDIDNIASKKIIEENGGVYENTFDEGNGKNPTLRYWIKVTK